MADGKIQYNYRCCAIKSDGTSPVLKMKISLPLSMADFTDAVQDKVRSAIAAAAGVDSSRVRILSFVEAQALRRLLHYQTLQVVMGADGVPCWTGPGGHPMYDGCTGGQYSSESFSSSGSIALEIEITVPPGGQESIIGAMTAENLKRDLAARELPQAQILEPPVILYEKAPGPEQTPEAEAAAKAAKGAENAEKSAETAEENAVKKDSEAAEAAAKSAEGAESAEKSAETAEENAVKKDSEAADAAKALAEKAAEKAESAKQDAKKTAEEEANAARQNMIAAERHEAAEIEKEREIVGAARAAYRKAVAEAVSAKDAEKMARHDVAEIEVDEQRTRSEADKAADEAENERAKAESERDAAERERFDAEDAARRSAVEEARAKDESDKARMERERAERAAQFAADYGISIKAAEERIAEEISAYRDSERDTLKRYRDADREEIEESEKGLENSIEKAQERIRRAQENVASAKKDSDKDDVRRAIRRASEDLRSEVKGVKDMVRDLRRQVDQKAAPPYSYGAPWGSPYQPPYTPVYGGALPYPPVYGARVYHNGQWKDKAIFLQRYVLIRLLCVSFVRCAADCKHGQQQHCCDPLAWCRELNDLEAERGLYERRLAVTAANIGLVKTNKAVAAAVALPRAVSVPVAAVGSFAPPSTTTVATTAITPAYAPYAGTAVPVVPAMPVGVGYDDPARAVPGSWGLVTGSPTQSSATIEETVLQQSKPVEMADPAGTARLTAMRGEMQLEAGVGQGWATAIGNSPLATQASMLATARGITAAAQGRRMGALPQQQPEQQQQQQQQQQALYQTAPAGVSAQTYRLQPGMSYTMKV